MNTTLGAVIALIILSALFSATETAYTSLSFFQLKTLENRRSRSGRLAFRLSQNREQLLTTALIGNNVVNLSASALVTTIALQYFSSPAVGYATGVLTLIILIFGEIVPKQLALAHNVRIAIFMAYPMKGLMTLLFPLAWLLRILASGVTRFFGTKEEPIITTEGMMHVVDAAEDVGLVDQYESDLMQRAIHFSSTIVRTIMTHRTEVFTLSSDLTIEEAFPMIVKSGFSRIPIYHENQENIVGVLLLRDVLRAQQKHVVNKTLASVSRKPIYVIEQMHLDDLFYLFKKDKLQQAIVVDEYGGFSGVVTMEDVAEQLFGELFDEHEHRFPDRVVEHKDRPGSFLVMADAPFQQVIDDLDLSCERERFSTVAAYLLEEAGSIPVEGEVIITPLGTWQILLMKGNKVEVVEFTPNPASVD